ncbi:oligopeptide ABC transporter substrate-binding protein [Trichococcus alkaliphilus]|uniref:oligopeptide ABC transporter substrate-binding protein n=1 Tax=Trichococcus alkaliphilus TaxID=2052943 RepID=UPI000D0B0C94|nr:oligopeptide ABC transporter substrate-binding protein [Trichococcus alkaliphilus]
MLNKMIVPFLFATLLAGCGNKEVLLETNGDLPGSSAVIQEFDTVMNSDAPAIAGGVLKYALVAESSFQGVFNPVFSEDAYDEELMGFSHESIFSYDEEFQLTQDGMATFVLNENLKTVSITMRDNLKWSDGAALTVDDILYAYEVIGHPDYSGSLYGEVFANVVGMTEYHEGTTDSIVGIEVLDDTHLTIAFEELNPSLLQAGGALWSQPLPRHQLERVPVADMMSSSQLREQPVGTGPFRVKSIIPGESVLFEANEYYWKGKPKLDNILVEVVGSATIVSEMEAGNYDVAVMPASSYESYKDFDNITLLGREELATTYIGFKLGSQDVESGDNALNLSSKMADAALRQAMAYALDNEFVAAVLFDGLRQPANAMVPPAFEGFSDDEAVGFSYDPVKASSLLDEAGYRDRDGDGFRETPDGEPLEINFAAVAGGDGTETVVAYYIQQWKEIGLDVSLATGRLIEYQKFHDMLASDSPAIDVYQATWGTGMDPNPTEMFGRTSALNYTRWANEENDSLLDQINAAVALDENARTGIYQEWQALLFEEAPVIPTFWRTQIFAVNNRVKNFNIRYGATRGWETIELTSEEPVR